MSVCVVIPAFNAARHLPEVMARLHRTSVSDLEQIVIVNDGSRDATSEVARRLQGPCPVEVIDRPKNGGYGAAMKDGLRTAARHRPEVVVCLHADGQYSPEVLPELLAHFRAHRLDLLQGSRIASGTALRGGMPLYKYLANAGLNRLENWVFELGFTDYHSGYLIYGRRAWQHIAFDRLSNQFHFDLEVIASARARGLHVREYPVPTHYGDEVSYLSPVRYGFAVLGVLLRYRLGHYHVH